MQISKTLRPCPFCKKLAAWEDNPWRPFCSERCKMIDLGFWAMGEYRVAGEDVAKESADNADYQKIRMSE